VLVHSRAVFRRLSVTVSVPLALAAGSLLLSTPHSGVAAARAETLHVAPNGSDSGDCSQSRPCKSFDRAYAAAAPGQTVEVAGGTYPDQDLRAGAKSAGPRVVFRPAAGASVAIGSLDLRGQKHVEFRSMKMDDWYIRHAEDVTFSNVTTRFFFVRVSKAVRILGGSVGPSQDGTSPTIGNYEGEPPSQNVVVDGVLFHDVGRQNCGGCHVECLFLQEAKGVVIRNSKFTHCDVMDLYVSPVQGGPTASDVLIENNWFDDPTDGGYYALDIHPDNNTAPVNFVVRYNSFNSGILLYEGFDYRNVRFVGNVGRIAECVRSGIAYVSNVWSNTKCGPTDRVARSGYVNAEGFDLHLAPGSPAIGAGTPGERPGRDLDGDQRPVRDRPDAGADQRESARISATGIGQVSIGAREQAVAGFYGRGSSSPVAGGRKVTYRVHGGTLWVVYAGDVVARVGTTSGYYATGDGVGPGADAKRARAGARPCGGAFRRALGPGAVLLRTSGSKIASAEVVKSTTGC
jgi:hypothetical protein